MLKVNVYDMTDGSDMDNAGFYDNTEKILFLSDVSKLTPLISLDYS
jgi:hypothetical protein